MAARGQRKRAKPKIANPLFCQWLQEWKEEAESKGWKSYHTYGMALSTLKKYPLRLERGKDCKILMHFGDKISGMLDKKLDEHIAAGRSLDPTPEDEDRDGGPAAPPAARNKRAAPAATASNIQSEPGTSTATASQAKKTRRSNSGSRPYIPAYRSGPYAIIVTLYQYTQVDRRGEYLTKNDLIRLAQPHSDKSLNVPDVGSYYTAFSSMSTLISKGLVDKFSSPAKYRLTNEGCLLAETLTNQRPPDNMSDSLSPPSASQCYTTGHVMSPPLVSATQTQAKSNRGIKPSAAKSKTPCGIQDDILTMSAATAPSTSSISNPSYNHTASSTTTSTTPYSHISTSSRPTTSSNTLSSTTSRVPTTQSMESSRPLFTLQRDQYDIVLIVDNREHYGFGNAKQHILPGLTKNGVKFDVRPLSVGDFIWIAQEKYGEKREVVLDYIVERKRLDDLSGSIVDGRYKEQKLRMKNSGLRKPIYLIEYYKTQENEKIKEDTLLQAVMNTQLRMKNSGLRKPIYLIEYYKTQENEKIKEDTLLQAVMNTQIIDKFYVKRCENIKASIAYLTLLHHQLVKLYSAKKIHAYDQDTLPDLPFNPHDLEMCHMTYTQFNSSGVKTKAPAVTECWKKMLMCIPGVSLGKANCIVESYPTYKRLIETYRSCLIDVERSKLLSNFKTGATNRKIGDMLSRNIYHLFYTSSQLT